MRIKIFKSYNKFFLKYVKRRKNIIYVPPARKLVFSLQLTVAQCSILRYRGNSSSSSYSDSTLLAKPCTFELRMRLLKSINTTQDQ